MCYGWLEESELKDVLREQIQLNTKEVVVNVDNDHMKDKYSP